MRQTYTATIKHLFWRKRFYSESDLPYTYVEMTNVSTVSGDVIAKNVHIRYSKSLHSLGLKKGSRIEFTAELDNSDLEDGNMWIFKRPAKYRIVELQSATLQVE